MDSHIHGCRSPHLDMEYRIWIWDECGIPYPWIWICLSGYRMPYLDMGSHIWIWDPVSGYGTAYLDVGTQIQIWDPISGYGMPYPDVAIHIEVRSSISRWADPIPVWKARTSWWRMSRQHPKAMENHSILYSYRSRKDRGEP